MLLRPGDGTWSESLAWVEVGCGDPLPSRVFGWGEDSRGLFDVLVLFAVVSSITALTDFQDF